jgi:hypothetical protein
MSRTAARKVDRPPASDADALPALFADSPVRWGDVDATVLRACVDALSSQGHATMLSRTSDGGTLVATFFVGGARPVKYFKDASSCEAFMRQYTEWLVSNS